MCRQWVARKNLRLLGENSKFDEVMTSKHQVRRPKMLGRLRAAYKWATSLAEIPGWVEPEDEGEAEEEDD